MTLLERAKTEQWTDEEIVERVREGDHALFELLMRRHNQRIYRVARSILRNDGEAEDVMQDAYVRAFEHLNQFEARAKFSTWLTRIAVYESLARVRRQSRYEALNDNEDGESMNLPPSNAISPEQSASSAETVALLESAILNLPEHYRSVLMMRDVEEMTTAEVGEVLQLSEENVKIRLHRARALLRKELYARAGASSTAAFQFQAPRCNRVVDAVMARIAERQSR